MTRDDSTREDFGPRNPWPSTTSADRIGDFRLVRKLGEGGMGVVYEAEQQHPRRPVALKVVRGGAHVSEDTLKLFEREAQTLASLSHSGIAALYEVGVTEDGLHFFAMELIRGQTLTAWLGQRPAGPMSSYELKVRLSIFRKICDAVAYAHQRGVIHRDLKPANVLIPNAVAESSTHEEIPDVKILDFGLARMANRDIQATPYVTEMGKVLGTLAYMSPEQVRGNPDEIDSRTDVYSLGVMLYELMTGQLPYDVSKIQISDAARIICESHPNSLSASFTGGKRLDADVITIANKCLEKESARRYLSAAQVGDDVERYLFDQPIHARPPSPLYQLRKLAMRRKRAFVFAATVSVLLLALAASTLQTVRVAKERDRANLEAERTRQVFGFLNEIFKSGNPSDAVGTMIPPPKPIDKDLGAAALVNLARVGLREGKLAESRALVHRALDLYDHAGERRTSPAAQALVVLGRLELADGRLDVAESALKEAVDTVTRLHGPQSGDLNEPLDVLAQVVQRAGRTAEAEALRARSAKIQ